MGQRDSKPYQVVLYSIVVGILILCIYLPGLSADFLLDDEGSLKSLLDMNGKFNLSTVLQFSGAGNAGPLGRPLSLLTFALNAQTWPTDPFPFLVTNVVIHLLNAFLVFVFLRMLFVRYKMNNRSEYLAGLAATLWAIHPYHVSTVLYVVQRMTLLATTFTLITIIFYLLGRANIIAGVVKKGLLFLLLAVLASGLAVLSKESAILLPVQILVVEAFLALTGNKFSGKAGLTIKLVVSAGAAVVVGYLGNIALKHTLSFIQSGFEVTYGRNFTMSERLLTESRVVWDYLYGILIPKIQSSGVFQDGYPVSSGLFNPPTTFLTLCFHSFLLFAACWWRRVSPVIFFGIVWFYSSLILESTVLMLELKFEHRNYLPSIGIILIVAELLLSIKNIYMARFSSFISVAILAVVLFEATTLWGDKAKAASVWVEENPHSARALEYAAKLAYETDDNENAKRLIRKEVVLTNSPTAELRYIAAFCESYDQGVPNWDSIVLRITKDQRDWSLYSTIETILGNIIKNKCNLVSLENFRRLLSAYRMNPVYEGNSSIQLMDNFEIAVLIHFQKIDEALQVDEISQKTSKYVPLAYVMTRAANFASGGSNQYAAERLRFAIDLAKSNQNENEYTVRSAEEMLTLINADAKTDASNP